MRLSYKDVCFTNQTKKKFPMNRDRDSLILLWKYFLMILVRARSYFTAMLIIRETSILYPWEKGSYVEADFIWTTYILFFSFSNHSKMIFYSL